MNSSSPLPPCPASQEKCWQQTLLWGGKTWIYERNRCSSNYFFFFKTSNKIQRYSCFDFLLLWISYTDTFVWTIMHITVLLFAYRLVVRFCCFGLMPLFAFIFNSRRTFICVLTRQHDKTRLRTTKRLSASQADKRLSRNKRVLFLSHSHGRSKGINNGNARYAGFWRLNRPKVQTYMWPVFLNAFFCGWWPDWCRDECTWVKGNGMVQWLEMELINM